MSSEYSSRAIKTKIYAKVLPIAAVIGWVANALVLIVPPLMAGAAYGVGGGIGTLVLSAGLFACACCPLYFLSDAAIDYYADYKRDQFLAAEEKRKEEERLIQEFQAKP